jgi:hypothetical protein
MLFISKILSKKQEDLSLIKMIDERLAGVEEQRTHKIVHISDLSRSDGFCPREFAILDVTKKKPKGRYISSALRVAFDNGNALSDLCRNKWLEQDVVGDWKCGYCKRIVVEFSKKPKVACKCGSRLWQYNEVCIINPHNGATGSIDFLIDFGLGKHTMIECKSMSRDMFDDLKAPLAEHRIRTQLYLLHWSQVAGPHAGKVDTERAIVLYISKGYGIKNEDFGGKVLPFKEFVVERDDAAVMPLYKRADAIYAFRKNSGPMPSGICVSGLDSRAKSCPVALECFSGTYPAGV